MKKLLFALLTLLLSLTLFACDEEPTVTPSAPATHTHAYATEWSSDATQHWKACTDSDCTEITQSAAHSFSSVGVSKQPTAEAEGIENFACSVCGATKTEALPRLSAKMPEADWITAFAFENVRIDLVAALVSAPNEAWEYTYMIDGSIATMTIDGETLFCTPDELLELPNFADCYAAFSVDAQGVYTAAAIELDDYMLENVRITFVNGKLSTISLRNTYPELPMLSSQESYTFSQWGEVEVTLPVLSAEALNAALDVENFENYTVCVSSYTTGASVERTLQFDGNSYYIVEDEQSGTLENAGTAMLPELALLRTTLQADNFTFDSESNGFLCTEELANFPGEGYTAKETLLYFEDGLLVAMDFLIDEDIMLSYYFYDYGITVPGETALIP